MVLGIVTDGALHREVLRSLAYTYFPRDVSYVRDTDTYTNSPEYRRLLSITSMYSGERRRYGNTIGSELQKVGTGLIFRDYSLFNWLDRCFNFQFVAPKEGGFHCICLNVSILIPFYTSYVLRVEWNDRSGHWKGPPVKDKDLKNSTYRMLLDRAEKVLEEGLYHRFPEELLGEVIKDVSFQEIGFDAFTFFNAFFLNRLYTRT